MSSFRSIVLLTTGSPQLRVDSIKRRMTRWTGLAFSDEKDEADNFIVGEAGVFMAKVAADCVYMLTLLDRPYWDSEDVEIYAEQARMRDDDPLASGLVKCHGAILFDAHVVSDGPTGTLHLAKLAAAAMEADTPVMVVPSSANVHRVGTEMRSALGRAREPAELMPYLLNFLVTPHASGQVLCLVTGMQFFDLPDLGMVCAADEIETAAAALQSTAGYEVQRGQAIALGETLTVPDAGDFRAIEPPFAASSYNDFGAMGLELLRG